MKKRLRHRCCTLNFANLKDNVFPKLHYLTFLTYMYGQSLVYSLIKLSVPCGVAIIPKNMKDKELCNYSWGKVFKGGLSKFCGRQPLKNLKGYGLLKQTISTEIFERLSSKKFTQSTLEYFVYDICPKFLSQMFGRVLNTPPC